MIQSVIPDFSGKPNPNIYRLVTNPVPGSVYYGISGKDEFGDDIYVYGPYSSNTEFDGRDRFTDDLIGGVIVRPNSLIKEFKPPYVP